MQVFTWLSHVSQLGQDHVWPARGYSVKGAPWHLSLLLRPLSPLPLLLPCKASPCPSFSDLWEGAGGGALGGAAAGPPPGYMSGCDHFAGYRRWLPCKPRPCPAPTSLLATSIPGRLETDVTGSYLQLSTHPTRILQQKKRAWIPGSQHSRRLK